MAQYRIASGAKCHRVQACHRWFPIWLNIGPRHATLASAEDWLRQRIDRFAFALTYRKGGGGGA